MIGNCYYSGMIIKRLFIVLIYDLSLFSLNQMGYSFSYNVKEVFRNAQQINLYFI